MVRHVLFSRKISEILLVNKFILKVNKIYFIVPAARSVSICWETMFNYENTYKGLE
jgi:hypothetical protein